MKTTKRFLSFLLTLAMMFSVIAVAVVPTAAAETSTSTVVVEVPLNGLMVSLDGTFAISGEATAVIKSVTVNNGWGGNIKVNDDAKSGSFMLFCGVNPMNCTITMVVEISGELYKTANIVFDYEYDETADLYAERKTASKQKELTVVNYAELRSAIARADSLVAGEYVTLDPIVEPLANAKAILNASYDQMEVTKATQALKNALNNLQQKVSFARLDKAIAAADKLDYFLYDLESWAELEVALARAKEIRATAGVNQPQITTAAITLEFAIENLKYASTEDLDLSVLQGLYEEYSKLKEVDFVEDGWPTFEAALAEAANVLQNGAVSQQYVDAVAEELRVAREALTPASPDNAELRVQIAYAENLNADDYVLDDAWVAFQTALENARAAVNSSLQSDIDAALTALLDAKAALTAINAEVNYDALNAAIAQAADYTDSSKYTSDSWDAFQAALANANAAKGSDDQSAVTTAAYELQLAIAKLIEVVTVDRTALNAAIADAEGRTVADYTDATWGAVKTALDAAKALTSSDDQAAVNEAAVALLKALAALEKKAPVVQIDYAKLNAAITAAEALNQADYTEDTWNAVASALNAAKAAKNSNDQREVDAATAALEVAVAALRAPVTAPTVEVDYTALNAAIAAAEAKTEADYTADSWTAVKTALDAAKALTSSDDQAAVTAAATALYDAIAALEKPVVAPTVEMDYSVLNGAISAAEALTEADYTAETWSAVTSALTAAKALTSSDDQAAVTAAAKALYTAIAALRAPVVTVPGESETVVVEPTDPFCNKGSHTVWPVLFGIFLALTVALAALIVVYLILKKKKENDDTPVVDYDIEEDEAAETAEVEEAAEEATETEVFAEDESDTTAE